jgi:hypothetical protein
MPCNHECKRCGERFEVAQKPLALVPSPPVEFVDMTFPCIGLAGKEWGLSARQTDDWREAFPGLDVLAECRKARVWLVANGLKTAVGMPRFLVAWLTKAADGRKAPAKASPYCGWHNTPGTSNKASLRPLAGCPTCKHLAAKSTVRESEPTPVARLLERDPETEAAVAELLWRDRPNRKEYKGG